MQTHELDTWAPGQRPPRARSTDPIGSHAAADRIESSGQAGRMMAVVLEAVRANPGRTSLELALLIGVERHETAKRLPDLRRRGLIESPPIDGDLRWWPVRPEDVARNATARSNALTGFREAGRTASREDLAAAEALERRVIDGIVERERGRLALRDVYRGLRRARVEADGRVFLSRPDGGA